MCAVTQVANASGLVTMVGHLFQNYDTIYVRFFPTYTCNHSRYTIYVRFLSTYTCVLSCFVGFYSQVYDHFLTNAHIYAHKKAHIYALQTSMWYMGFTESRRIRGTDIYYTVSKKLLHVRWSWKVTSVWIKQGRNSRGRGYIISLSEPFKFIF